MNEKLKDQDILLVKEKGSNELKVATNTDGKIKNVNPNEENPDFLKIDKHANALENFFENFMRQAKNPTRFEFFRIPAENFEETTEKLQEAFKNPDKPENKEFLDKYRVDPETILKKQEQAQAQSQGQTQTSPSNNAIDESRVDWNKLEQQWGVSRETLEKTGNLEKLLNWQKTDLLPVVAKFDDTTLRTDARISLRDLPNGNLSVSIHAIRKEPELERPYFGIKFTNEDKQNLLKTGNLGRIVEAEYKQGEKTPIIISIDKQTNELVAFHASKIKVPETIKGIQLNEQQKKELSEGKSVYLENMISKKNTPFSAYLQFNADKRGFEFRFDNSNKQENSQKKANQKDFYIPNTLGNVKLTEKQQRDLRADKTIYVFGMVDKKGQEYNAYVKVNRDEKKLDFFKYNPDKAQKITPDNASKTQVAVNSEGKTNEVTKKVDDPLKKGQVKPTEEQKKQQENKQTKPQSKGRKM